MILIPSNWLVHLVQALESDFDALADLRFLLRTSDTCGGLTTVYVPQPAPTISTKTVLLTQTVEVAQPSSSDSADLTIFNTIGATRVISVEEASPSPVIHEKLGKSGGQKYNEDGLNMQVPSCSALLLCIRNRSQLSSR